MTEVEQSGTIRPKADVGQCTVTYFEEPIGSGWRLRIDRADPSTWITAELLESITKSWEPVIENGIPKGWTGSFGEMTYTDRGTVLRIDAENGSVTYRLDEYNHQRNAWLARWPD